MTFDPVLPPLFLGVIAVVLFGLRAVALRLAAASGRRAVLRWSVTTTALVLLLLAAARPGTGPTPAESEAPQPTQSGANVYFVVDRSADSAVTDYRGAQRMSGIRDDIETLIGAHPGARFAVIAFASRPAIDWPLSDDAWSLEPVVDTLTPYAGAGAESTSANAGAAANVLRYQLIAAGQQYPRSPNLVYYLGSGAPGSTVPQGVFETSRIDGGAVLGYGTGGDADALRGIADQLGLPYVRRGIGEELPPTATAADQAAAGSTAAPPRRVEWYWACTMAASLLLLVEICLTARDLRRSRATRREVLP